MVKFALLNVRNANRAGIHKNNAGNRRSTYRVDFFASRLKSQLFPWIHCGIHEKGSMFGGFFKKVDSF
jgi:hypothetical protein